MTIHFTDGGTLECNRIELCEKKLYVDEYILVDMSEVDYIES